ncbi:DUF1217 domain-containing protein [Peteryoungia desertarenae]|uniref:DUF1217 domain-containing protein n=1 Tax=Peteryoungia desertarenae TaxID=1813451 RepID=A0ABX6QM51_9HYPH|nr:DUF1217 domain-containing protein [Peteryoungia desertarenae]QLF69352.1 DUF1217 domain-containing protein [Peteryoungia desertarenae]
MTTTYTNYKLITQNLDKTMERVAKQPDVARETEYYLSKIGDVKSIDDFMADSRLYNYALKAHGLEDMAYAKAFIRKVLTEGVSNDEAFANQLTDSRYAELAKALNFEAFGAAATAFDSAQKDMVSRYMRQTLEADAGNDNTGVRLALYFDRNASKIKSGMDILADDALAQVVRTALQIPDEVAASDIDKQAGYLEKRLDIESFQDPEEVSKFLERFTALWELDNPSEPYDPLAVFGSSSGFGISADLLISINSLKRGGS